MLTFCFLQDSSPRSSAIIRSLASSFPWNRDFGTPRAAASSKEILPAASSWAAREAALRLNICGAGAEVLALSPGASRLPAMVPVLAVVFILIHADDAFSPVLEILPSSAPTPDFNSELVKSLNSGGQGRLF